MLANHVAIVLDCYYAHYLMNNTKMF